MADAVPDLILDACCLINLYVAELFELPASPTPVRRRIPRPKTAQSSRPTLPYVLHVAANVLNEALYIRKRDEDDQARIIEAPVDLSRLLNGGLLHSCEMQNQAEVELFIELAAMLDDGEAVSMAIAKTRRWAIASDDRKARRIAEQLGVQTVTTPELVKTWADSAGARAGQVGQVLRNIEAFARFSPHKSMPLHKWWTETITKA
jgi:predicted nucleic acid-binding protein